MKPGKLIFLLFLATPAAFAQEPESTNDNGKVKIYGEVSNHASWHSREGLSDETGLFYLLPKEPAINEVGIDLNAASSFNFLGITSRLGVRWDGFSSGNLKLAARIDGDFFCFSGKTPVLRLRNAFVGIGFNHGWAKGLSILAGQTWHPLSVDRPHTFNLSCGAPFNPYSYAPQVKLNYEILPWLGVSAAALWQTNYCSTGPDGQSTQYINWSCTPELYADVNFHVGGFSARAGVDFLSIKPRLLGIYPNSEVYIHVNDKVNTLSPYIYAEYTNGRWNVKGKSIFANSGEHVSLLGGYAIRSMDDNGNFYYSVYRNSSSWVSGQYSWGNLNCSLMLGYVKNLGTGQRIYNQQYIYYYKDAYNFLRAARVTPSVTYTWKKHLQIGLEYELNATQYGSYSDFDYWTGLADSASATWVMDHGITLRLACFF